MSFLFTSPSIILSCFGGPSNDPFVCSGNGECLKPNYCLCNQNYTGNNCQFQITYCYGYSSAHFMSCSGNGVCNSTDSCICNSNYGGSNCQSRISNIYVSGQNLNYQLGIGAISAVPLRTLVTSLVPYDVIQIECSDSSCFALTSDFIVLGSGLNGYGILGLNDTIARDTFTVLNSFNNLNITRIQCGGFVCFFLTSSQTWYGTGKNTYGTLGVGSAYTNQTTPLSLTIINSLNLDRIESPGYFEFAIGYSKTNNLLYSWGDNTVRIF
jgi:hypothetical protein